MYIFVKTIQEHHEKCITLCVQLTDAEVCILYKIDIFLVTDLGLLLLQFGIYLPLLEAQG